MTLRSNLTDRKRKAHQILDEAKAGADVSLGLIRWALAVLGDVE